MPGVESIRKFFTSDYEDNDGDDDDCEKKTRQDKKGSEGQRGEVVPTSAR